MWNFIHLNIKNLYSHTDSTFHFKQNELTQLIGKNNDEFVSNGAGKSGLMDGISLALIAEPCRKVSKTDFIRNEEKSCYVELLMKNDFLKKEILIKREFFRKNSTNTSIFVNGEEYDLLVNNRNDPNKFILDNLGISKEDLQNYFLIGQNNKNSFLTINDTKQKEIIGRFSNFTLLDKLEKELKEKKNELLEEAQSLTSQSEIIKSKIDSLREHQKSEERLFEENKKRIIEGLKERFKQSKTFLSRNKEEQQKLEKNINKLKQKIEEADFNNIKKQIQEFKLSEEILTDKKKEIDNKRSKYYNSLGKLERLLGGKVKCPDCGNEFIPESEDGKTIKEINKLIAGYKSKLKKQKSEYNEVVELLSELRDKQVSLKHKLEENSDLKEELEELEETYNNNKDFIQEEKDNLKRFKEEIIEEEGKAYKPNKTKLKGLLEEQRLLNERLVESENKINDNEFKLYHIGKKGFKTYLSNQAIKHIEDMSNYFLKKFTNFRIKISGYKILKSKEVREKIDISIIRNGEENFNKFSGGEQSVINICCLLALHKLINNSLESGGINFLALDEYIISMDEENEREAIDLLSKTNITTLLIMQHTYSYGNNMITIEKNNGISKILPNE